MSGPVAAYDAPLYYCLDGLPGVSLFHADVQDYEVLHFIPVAP